MIEILQKSPLFAGMDPGEIQHILQCLGNRQKRYRKNEYIFMEELCKQTINPLQIPNWLKQLR